MTNPKTGPADTTKGDGERRTQPTTEPDPVSPEEPEGGESGDKVLRVTGYVAEFNFEDYSITTAGTLVKSADVAKIKEAAKHSGVELRESKVK